MSLTAYFKNIQEEILKQINEAKSSIQVAVAWVNDEILFEAICDKANSGTKVELIILLDSLTKNNIFNHYCPTKNSIKFPITLIC